MSEPDLPQAVVEGTDLRKSYRVGALKTEVLRGVDITVREGDFLLLFGPSGSGKSTLLHLLGLMEPPSSGSLLFAGRDTAKITRSDRARLRCLELGFVFQTFNLLPTMNARQNVELPMRLAGVPRRERKARAGDLLDEVGLGHRLEHRPAELSGGERQRVAIARALANDPKLVIADEPTGNLDSGATHSVMSTLAGFHARGGTLLVVTHNPEVASYAGRVMSMRDGTVSEHGDMPMMAAGRHNDL